MKIAHWLAVLLASVAARGAELDLFVTDYNENPSREQRPLAERPKAFASPREVVVTTADGRKVSFRGPRRVRVEPRASGNVREARIFAARGEREPFSFLLRPKEPLQEVFIHATDLVGPGGKIAASNIVVASVERFHGGGRDILMPLGRKWPMPAYSTEFFWYTVHVPREAKAGTYRGKVVVTARGEPVGELDVVLEVLPFELDEPPFALGLNYSSPKDPAALRAHLADMRAHGMTSVGPLYNFHLPVHDDDTSELGAFIEAYKRAGFPAPIYFATPMNLQLTELAGYGDERSKRWQLMYIKVMQRLQREVRRHGVPVIMSIGDEFTNKGIEGVKVAGRLARFVWEELPEIATASDMNGYMEVMAMAPYLNVAAFNNGWDGIDHHNKGRRLINREFITQVRRLGAIPWFVNGGVGRFPFGFFFWKMTKFGVRGKIEWYYNLRNERGSLVRTSGTTVYPTLDYERCREGIDDLRYLCKLEGLMAKARKAGRAAAEAARAEQLLRKIADAIRDDWTAYRSGGAVFPPEELLGQLAAGGAMNPNDAVRRAVADQIAALLKALR